MHCRVARMKVTYRVALLAASVHVEKSHRQKIRGSPPPPPLMRTPRTTHSLFACGVHTSKQRHAEGHWASAEGQGTPRQCNGTRSLDLESMYIDRSDARHLGHPIAKNHVFPPQVLGQRQSNN